MGVSMYCARPYPPQLILRGFVSHVLRRYRYEDKNGELAYLLTIWAEGFDLTLRQIERACPMRFLGRSRWLSLLSFLVALQIKHPEVFDRMRLDEMTVYARAQDLLNAVLERIARPEDSKTEYVQTLRDFIMVRVRQRVPDGQQPLDDATARRLFGQHFPGRGSRTPIASMKVLMQQLDFDIDWPSH